MRFTTAADMATIDQRAVEEYGLTEAALMENAGQLTARHTRRRFLDDRSPGRVGVFCGKGHNGADGLVVARWLDQWGYDVHVYLLHDVEAYDDLPGRQLTALERRSDVPIETYEAGQAMPPTDLWVDAMLGTGLSGDPRPPYSDAIHWLNSQPAPVVAVDVPSGLSGNDNRPFDPCIQADLTVTYGLPKLGMLLEPGYAFAGTIIAQEIGFPVDLYDEHSDGYHLISPVECSARLPRRYPTAHKGTAGRLAVIGGSHQYTGAPFLVGNAASRAGAGLTSLIGPPELARTGTAEERDLVYPHALEDILSEKDSPDVQQFLANQDAFVVGPGLGRSEVLRDGLRQFLPELDVPAVLDADGLNNMTEDLDVLEQCERLVLTPHPGEAARLLERDVRAVTNRPLEAIDELVQRTGQTVVLKTSRPLVGHPDGSYSVNVTGTAALSKAGSGDVLSGMIGAFLAQGLDPSTAACLGLYLQGAAGRLASEELDTVSVRSSDVIENIPGAIRDLENDSTPDWYPVKYESQHDEVLRWNPFPS
jgi:NAD(P)H-hydrate epimerase